MGTGRYRGEYRDVVVLHRQQHHRDVRAGRYNPSRRLDPRSDPSQHPASAICAPPAPAGGSNQRLPGNGAVSPRTRTDYKCGWGLRLIAVARREASGGSSNLPPWRGPL